MADVLLVDAWGSLEATRGDDLSDFDLPEGYDMDWARKNGVVGDELPETRQARLTAQARAMPINPYDSDITPTPLEILAAGGDVQKATETKVAMQREKIEAQRKNLAEANAEINKDTERVNKEREQAAAHSQQQQAPAKKDS